MKSNRREGREGRGLYKGDNGARGKRGARVRTDHG